MAVRSVLVVDPTDETQEVLRAALEPRGLRILQARAAAQAIDLARRHQPDLIVLDLEISENEADTPDVLRARANAEETPIIMLGTGRRACRPGEQFVAKPYHYAPLIRRIESLLQARRAA